MSECSVLSSGHCGFDLWPSFANNRVRSISSVLFEIGNPKFDVWVHLRLRSVAYHYQAIATLTYDLVMELPLSGCILGWWIGVYYLCRTICGSL